MGKDRILSNLHAVWELGFMRPQQELVAKCKLENLPQINLLLELFEEEFIRHNNDCGLESDIACIIYLANALTRWESL